MGKNRNINVNDANCIDLSPAYASIFSSSSRVIMVFIRLAHIIKIFQINAGYIGTAEHRQLTVPVFSDNKCMDTSRIHTQFISQHTFQSRRVKHRTGTKHTV